MLASRHYDPSGGHVLKRVRLDIYECPSCPAVYKQKRNLNRKKHDASAQIRAEKATTKAVKAAAAKAVKAAAAVEKAVAEAAKKAPKQRRKRVAATTGRDTSSSPSNVRRRDVRRLPFCLPSSRISSRADLPYSELVN